MDPDSRQQLLVPQEVGRSAQNGRFPSFPEVCAAAQYQTLRLGP